MDPKNKVFITWEQVDEMTDNIAQQIKGDGINPIPIKAIIGIPRGGLVPAVLLSHKLSVPMITILEYQNNVDDFISRLSANEVLVVDDICDSGKTLLWPGYKDCLTAVLIQKHEDMAKKQATFHARFMDYHELHDWIVFPWEKKDSSPYADHSKQIME